MGRRVLVCHGKNCRRRIKSWEPLERAIDGVDVEIVECQKICRPPVVGTEVDGNLEWFAALDSAKSLQRLRQLLDGGRLRKALKKRLIKKRSGKLR